MRRSEEVIIFNHPHIPSPTFVRVDSTSQIANIAAKDVVWFDFDFEMLRFCQRHDIRCAVDIQELTQAVFANALGATFLVCELSLAKEVQKVADHYLFDSKVIATISEDRLKEAIEAGIDGVLLTRKS